MSRMLSKISGIVKRVIDFDSIEEWEADLRAALSSCVTDAAISEIARSNPEYVEDARDLLFKHAERDEVIDATLAWLRSSSINAYHGTRLTDAEIESVRQLGLVPLNAGARRARLDRALSGHPGWAAAQRQMDTVLADLGQNNSSGHREGQVHLTLSRAGLANGFNHYLTHGAEFDQHAAQALLGDEGLVLLAKDGKKTIIRAFIAGDRALQACHPHLTVEDRRSRGDVPNLVDQFLRAWSYRLAHPGFDPRTLEVDCGFVFKETVPPGWIMKIESPPA
jgi:hypothetical protein